MSRPASHAGSWYSATPTKLRSQIREWLDAALGEPQRFLVGPHAGLRFCGHILGKSYGRLSPNTSRVFILSPCHVEYFPDWRVSRFSRYETPLGNVEVDTDITGAIHEAGVRYMSLESDIKEHGIEMHLPFLKTVAPDAKIVPIIVGDMTDVTGSRELAHEFLGKYLNDETTAFVVSTDFCHWGKPFGYRVYRPSPTSKWISLSHTPTTRPIWQSIQELDRMGMDAASTGDAIQWRKYIHETQNTVCGQAPLGIVMGAANAVGKRLEYQWLGYDQSSKVESAEDMSVSYASAIASLSS